jgi:hypothetical protein
MGRQFTSARHGKQGKKGQKFGLPVKPIDQTGTSLVEPLIHVGDERLLNVNAWLEQEQKKGRPGN